MSEPTNNEKTKELLQKINSLILSEKKLMFSIKKSEIENINDFINVIIKNSKSQIRLFCSNNLYNVLNNDSIGHVKDFLFLGGEVKILYNSEIDFSEKKHTLNWYDSLYGDSFMHFDISVLKDAEALSNVSFIIGDENLFMITAKKEISTFFSVNTPDLMGKMSSGFNIIWDMFTK